MGFDPSAAASPEAGIFGLETPPEEAGVHVFGVPFDATASYRKGAARGPRAILAASRQVDLFDLETGRPFEAGIWMEPLEERLVAWNAEASVHAERVIARGGRVVGDAALEAGLERVRALQEELNGWLHERTAGALAADRLPCVVGGDHSVSFGALRAAAERHPGLGVFHVDAHADLREAYEGFAWSHASILHNVVERLDGVERVVQVGIRDLCEEEHAAIEGSGGRIRTLFHPTWAAARAAGEDLRALVRATLEPLPRDVWVTFDVDGLDPLLCPNTGTPVPGGLTWDEAMLWLAELARSGRRIVGCDLVEVAPGPEGGGRPEGEGYDEIVGARLLYRMIGYALLSRGRA